jgi:hypothetical protein
MLLRSAQLLLICLLFTAACLAVADAIPAWRAPLASIDASEAAPLLDQMVLAYHEASSAQDWERVAGLAEAALVRYGDVYWITPKPNGPQPPKAVLAEARTKGILGLVTMNKWEASQGLPLMSTFKAGSPAFFLLTALERLDRWSDVESLALSTIGGVSAAPPAPGYSPTGVYAALQRARRQLGANQEASAQLSPIALAAQRPGYVTAPLGSAELRRVAQWLGGSLTWDKAAQTGRLKLGKETWAFKLGSRTVASSSGKRMELPATVKMYAGRLRVPLEALKIAGTVKWDSTTRIAWFTPKQG